MGFQEEFADNQGGQNSAGGKDSDKVCPVSLHPETTNKGGQIDSKSSESSIPTPGTLNQMQNGDDNPPSGKRKGDEAPPQPPLSLPPGHVPRAGGWTKRKMVDFLEALAETCSVSDAAKTVYMSRSSAYRLRARLAGTPFDLAWEAAFENGLRQLCHSALDRAVNGVMQPVFHKGEQVGEKRVFNERLTWLMMTHAGQIGRNPLAREHGLNDWDALLGRVEHGDLDWATADQEAYDDEETQAKAEEYIRKRSEYGSKWIFELEREEAGRNLKGRR